MLHTCAQLTRSVRLAKNDLRFGFAKKLRFLARFQFYKIDCGFSFSIRFFCTVCFLMCMHSAECFPVYCFITVLGKGKRVRLTAMKTFHLRLYGMMLEIVYFRAELIQLIISRSNSELEVQRYGMKKNTLTVDPIMKREL